MVLEERPPRPCVMVDVGVQVNLLDLVALAVEDQLWDAADSVEDVHDWNGPFGSDIS